MNISYILWGLIAMWFFCYGLKFETAGLRFYINGMFHSYSLTEDLVIEVVIKDE